MENIYLQLTSVPRSYGINDRAKKAMDENFSAQAALNIGSANTVNTEIALKCVIQFKVLGSWCHVGTRQVMLDPCSSRSATAAMQPALSAERVIVVTR